MVNHLLFADDSIIFYTVEMETNKRVQKLLEVYVQASSQLINSDKIVMVFSKNTPEGLRQELMSLWRNGRNQQYENYLGLPPFIGRAK